MAEDYIIQCDNLVKIYKTDETEVMALQGLDAKVARGELMAIIGNSGSGKSTFLNMIGGLDRPTAGRLYVDGLDLFKLSDADLNASAIPWALCGRTMQETSFLPPCRQNVQMPMLFSAETALRKGAGAGALDIVGLFHKRKAA